MSIDEMHDKDFSGNIFVYAKEFKRGDKIEIQLEILFTNSYQVTRIEMLKFYSKNHTEIKLQNSKW